MALESRLLVSTTPLCSIITTVPGGQSCWNFLFLWTNSGAPTSALSSGIVPVSMGVDPEALWAWGGSCTYCGQIYRKGDKGGKKASSGGPEVRGLTPREALKAKTWKKTQEVQGVTVIWRLIASNLEYLNRSGRHSFRKTILSGGLRQSLPGITQSWLSSGKPPWNFLGMWSYRESIGEA